MNVALFLTPKAEVAWLPIGATIRQALEHLEAHGYTAVPLLDQEGRYVGTLTEGDLLRVLVRTSTASLDAIRLAEVPRRSENKAVTVVAEIDAIVQVAVDQNFVPVVDSRRVLMGIVTRRAIIGHLRRKAGEAPSDGR